MSVNNRWRVFSIQSLVGVVAFAMLALVIPASAADVAELGLITQVQGTVNVTFGKGKATAATPFVKLSEGAKVDVGADSRFQVVYLNSGRQETWAANSQLEIGATQSKTVKVAQEPTVKQLSPMILKGLTQAPMMIADMRARQGMIRVRAMGDLAKLEEAEQNYASLRKQSPEDDVTPELFLMATLKELKLYKKMQQPLDEMLARQPNSAEIKALHADYMAQIGANIGVNSGAK